MSTASKSYGIKECANPDCNNKFEARRINQIYCSNECCRVTTNAKLIAKYHEGKNKRNQVRQCEDCGKQLSKYNPDSKCHACQIRSDNNKRIKLLGRLGIEYIDESIGEEIV
jgi:hypothetical protein